MSEYHCFFISHGVMRKIYFITGPINMFKTHLHVIKDNEKKFSVNAESIEKAFTDLLVNGPPTDAWDSVGPHIAFQNVEKENEGVVVNR